MIFNKPCFCGILFLKPKLVGEFVTISQAYVYILSKGEKVWFQCVPKSLNYILHATWVNRREALTEIFFFITQGLHWSLMLTSVWRKKKQVIFCLFWSLLLVIQMTYSLNVLTGTMMPWQRKKSKNLKVVSIFII